MLMLGPVGTTSVAPTGGVAGGTAPPAVRGPALSVGIRGSDMGMIHSGRVLPGGRRDTACWRAPRTACGSSARGCAPSVPKVPQNSAPVTSSRRMRTERQHSCLVGRERARRDRLAWRGSRTRRTPLTCGDRPLQRWENHRGVVARAYLIFQPVLGMVSPRVELSILVDSGSGSHDRLAPHSQIGAGASDGVHDQLCHGVQQHRCRRLAGVAARRMSSLMSTAINEPPDRTRRKHGPCSRSALMRIRCPLLSCLRPGR